MKQHFVVKRWPPELAFEEVQLEIMPFWVQIRGVPLYLHTENNVKRLAREIGDFIGMEDLSHARGFLRVRVDINTRNPLATGCWLPRPNNKETWIEFRYERLQNFYYRCGRIRHVNTECSFGYNRGGATGYEEWTQTAAIRDIQESPRQLVFS
ncbi:hypothetical protein ACFX1T_002951 [Malus domestica]